MGIFTVIFSLVIFKPCRRSGDPSGEELPLYFLAGVLPFNFFSISIGTSMGAITRWNGSDQKVQFPAGRGLCVRWFVRHPHDQAMGMETCCADDGFDAAMATGVVLASGPARGVHHRRITALAAANTSFTTTSNYLWGILSQILFYGGAGRLDWPGGGGRAGGSRKSPTGRPAASSSPPTT